jgi:hypothetical protein
MIDFLLHPANSPFAIALAVMLVFTVLEIISASFGMGFSEMVDSILPEFDADIDVDVDVDADIHAVAPDGNFDSLVKLLAWFRVGEVPVVMLFIVFLTGFGLSGLMVQYVSVSLVGVYMPTIIATGIGIIASIPVVRVCGGLLGKYMPKDETYVVSEKSFYGMIATVTLGTAEPGKPAQAKIRDKHGQTHYILVEPDTPGERFATGEQAIVVKQVGAIYKVIEATSAAMSD